MQNNDTDSERIVTTDNLIYTVNDQSDIEEPKFTNGRSENKSFGFRIAIRNVRVSVVMIKRIWKKRATVREYVKKRKIWKKTQDKEFNLVSKQENFQKDKKAKVGKKIPPELTGDRKWLFDQYKQLIGIPKRMSNPNITLCCLKAKRWTRFVPESFFVPKPKKSEAVFLASKEPTRKCFCPLKDCYCSAYLTNKKRKIPGCCRFDIFRYMSRYIDLPTLNIYKICTRRVDIKRFIENLNVAINRTNKFRKGSFQTMDPLCLTKCVHCRESFKSENIRYLPFIIRTADFIEEIGSQQEDDHPKRDKGDDERICKGYSCTVSTETDFGPDGQLNLKKYSHWLFSNVDKTVLPDITGKRLHIAQCQQVPSSTPINLDMQLPYMNKLLYVKEIKSRFSKLLSSLFEVQDARLLVGSGDLRSRAPDDNDPDKHKNISDVRDIVEELVGRATDNNDPGRHKSISDVGDIVKELDNNVKKKINSKLSYNNQHTCECYNEPIAKKDIAEKERQVTIENVGYLPRNNLNLKLNEVRSDNKYENDVKMASDKHENIIGKKFKDLEINDDKKNVDKSRQNKVITESKEMKPCGVSTSPKVSSDKIPPEDKSDAKKTVKYACLKFKTSSLVEKLSSASHRKSKSSKPVIINQDDKEILNVESEVSILRVNQNTVSKSDNKDTISSLNDSDKRQDQKDSKTSKDKIFVLVNAFSRKVSTAFKWLFDQIIFPDEINKTASTKSSGTKSKIKLNELKMSEKEVFSMKYTSTISVSKKSISGTDK